MSEIITNILMAIICAAVPTLSAAIVSAINKLVEQQAQKTQSALIQFKKGHVHGILAAILRHFCGAEIFLKYFAAFTSLCHFR